jgi:DNA polymerase I-like protein with 3'-5' exonuclease and polymerase domains
VSLDLPNIPEVVVDVEAGGLFPDDGARIGCVGLAWGDWRMTLPFDQGERDKIPDRPMELWEEQDPNLGRDEWEEMFDWLEDRAITAHNAKYDLTMLHTGTRSWPGRDLIDNLSWDTLIAQRVLDPTELAGLDSTADRLGIGKKADTGPMKAWLKKRKYDANRYDLIPWSMIEAYLDVDLRLTYNLRKNQELRIANDEEGPRWLEQIERELEVLKVLYKMEHRGVGYDLTRSLQAAAVLERHADEVEKTMPFQAQPNAAKAWYFDKLKLKPMKTTEKGAPSIDDEQIREWKQTYEETGDPVYQWAAEYETVTRLRRAVSMWYRGYPEKAGADGRLRTYYKQAHVKSGRMSVQRIQLQAIPKRDKVFEVEGEDIPHVRDLLRARPGHGLWNLDLKQAELRVAAKYSGCQTMIDMLLGGADFHSDTTENVLKVSRDHPLWSEKRDIGKRLNFSAIFMVGGKKFQATLSKLADIHLPLDECDRYVREWRAKYPEFEIAYRKSMDESHRRRGVRLLPKTPLETVSYFMPYEFHYDRWIGRDVVKEAWNRKVQGSLAEFNKLWLAEVERKWPGYLVLNVHDSIVLEAPEDEGEQLAAEVCAHTAVIATDLFDIEMGSDSYRMDKHAVAA